jgi:PPOX class probable F420-dependent enzyme
MAAPRASRPYMPGYGVQPSGGGSGLLPWSWAVERLTASHDYWVATVSPGGQPHVMPVWGVWHEEGVWFSSSRSSRKARNLDADPRATITTDNAVDPVVLEGVAELVADLDRLASFVAAVNGKYGTDYSTDFFDPATNACFRLGPRVVFGLASADFTGSPTRWSFAGSG